MSMNKATPASFYTYLHCKPNGDIFYVGKGRKGRGHSTRSHDFKHGRSRYHRFVVQKYGVGNIQVFVFPCDSEEQALADEVHQIEQLRLEGYKLANITNGGEGVSGWIASPETKEKMSASASGRKHTPEARLKMSLAAKGRIFSDAHRAKLALAKKGKTSNKKGIPISDAQKAKISTALKGRISNRKGARLSNETKARISEGHKQRRENRVGE